MSDWEDLFGDNMSVDEDDPGGQSSNDLLLQTSDSAMSNRATTSNSPNTAPAPAFRPPQPRNTPASATSRPSGSRACLNKFADLLKLTKDHQNVLQKVIDNTLPGEEYISTLSYLAFVCQESKGGSPMTLKWVPSRAIREAFKEQGGEFILRADVQAYSKTVAEDCTTMVQSLEVLTFNYLKGLKADFLEEHGPGDYLAGEACIPGTTMYLFVKETLKNQRSKVRTALLTKILGVAEDAIVKVPAGKSMVLQVARTFLPKLRALPDNDALKMLGRAKLKRIIFMRTTTSTKRKTKNVANGHSWMKLWRNFVQDPKLMQRYTLIGLRDMIEKRSLERSHGRLSKPQGHCQRRLSNKC